MEMREPRESIGLLPESVRWDTTGGGAARWAWHRKNPGHGARSPFCSWATLRPAWTEYYAGPGILTANEKKGPRPWPGFIRGSPIKFWQFLFFLPPSRLNFLGNRSHTHFLKERAGGERTRITWRDQRKRAKDQQWFEEGREAVFFAVTLPRACLRLRSGTLTPTRYILLGYMWHRRMQWFSISQWYICVCMVYACV